VKSFQICPEGFFKFCLFLSFDFIFLEIFQFHLIEFESFHLQKIFDFHFSCNAVEAFGDITANSLISGEPVEGPVFMKRAQGGILADGLNSMIAAVFNSFPNSIFAQNNGMIQLTGVASRYVGYFVAGALFVLGLFPVIGQLFSLIPDCVLGGATLLMFGTVAAAGIRIIASTSLDRKAVLVLAISFSMGMSVELVPEILGQMPPVVKSIFSSGITTGGIAAMLANACIRIKK